MAKHTQQRQKQKQKQTKDSISRNYWLQRGENLDSLLTILILLPTITLKSVHMTKWKKVPKCNNFGKRMY